MGDVEGFFSRSCHSRILANQPFFAGGVALASSLTLHDVANVCLESRASFPPARTCGGSRIFEFSPPAPRVLKPQASRNS